MTQPASEWNTLTNTTMKDKKQLRKDAETIKHDFEIRDLQENSRIQELESKLQEKDVISNDDDMTMDIMANEIKKLESKLEAAEKELQLWRDGPKNIDDDLYKEYQKLKG